jgi:flagellar hook-length control protein FliK
LPAAVTIGPVNGGSAVTAAIPSPPGGGEDAFGQVLRSVQHVASETDGGGGPAVQSFRGTPPTLGEVGSGPPLAIVPPQLGQAAATGDPPPVVKPARTAKNDRRAAYPQETASICSMLGPVAPAPDMARPVAPTPAVPRATVSGSVVSGATVSGTNEAPSTGCTSGSFEPDSLKGRPGQAGAGADPDRETAIVDSAANNDLSPKAAYSGTPFQPLKEATKLPPQPGREPTSGITPGPVQASAPNAASSPSPAPDRKNGLRATEMAGNPAPRPANADLRPELTMSPATVAPAPAPLAVEATAPAHSRSPATPASQIAPALLTLAKTQDGDQLMTVRLHPADLGMVQVRIERSPFGSTQVEITAAKSDTLQVLQRDQAQLHRTLDDAGIPASGRTLTFHIAQPVQPFAGGNASAHSGGQQATPSRATGSNTDSAGSASDSSGWASGGGKGSYLARETAIWSGSRRQTSSAAAVTDNLPSNTPTYRIGLDITA